MTTRQSDMEVAVTLNARNVCYERSRISRRFSHN
jgi:hypothetical protein